MTYLVDWHVEHLDMKFAFRWLKVLDVLTCPLVGELWNSSNKADLRDDFRLRIISFFW